MKNITEMMDLTGRTALITGATGGIGQEVASTIAELGGNLILVDKPSSNYDLMKRKILSEWHVDIRCVDCNLEEENQRLELTELIRQQYPSLEILVNNAAFVGDSQLQGWAENLEKQTIESVPAFKRERHRCC